MHADTVVSYTRSEKGDFCITICHFLLSQAVLYSDHYGMTFLVLKSSSSLIAYVKGLAMFGVQYKDPGVSFCHGKFWAKEWISHGKNAKYRWNSAKAMGLFSSGSVSVVSFYLPERVLLAIAFIGFGFKHEGRWQWNAWASARTEMGAKTTVRLVTLCKDKKCLLFTSILLHNSSWGPGVHNGLWWTWQRPLGS